MGIKISLLFAVLLLNSASAISFVLRTPPSPSLKVNKVAVNPQFPPGIPAYSDVLFTSRWDWSPGNLIAMAEFGATKSVWTYTTNAAYIAAAKEIVSEFQCAILSRVNIANNPAACCLDLNGDPISYDFLRTDPQLLAEGDVCRPAFKDFWLASAKGAIDAGCDSIQQDNIGQNADVFEYGGSFSAEAMAAFNVYLSNTLTTVELADLGIQDIAIYDYAEHLRSLTNSYDLVGDDFGPWTPGGVEGELKQLFFEFEKEAAVDFYNEVFLELENYANRTIHFSGNNIWQETWCYSAFDYMQGELVPSQENVLSAYTRIRDTRAYGKLQALIFYPTYNIALDRKIIAWIYASGGLPIAPWDVWMGSLDIPRYFGDPADYSDLYGFVKDHAEYFDGYEDAAVTGRMGPYVETVTYDVTNSRTTIRHAWSTRYEDIPGGSVVVLNGISYTTSGLTKVGSIYLAGNQTNTIHKGDLVTRIANSDLERDYMVELNGYIGLPLAKVSFNAHFYGQGPTTIIEYAAHTNFMSISSGASVVINEQSFNTSRSSGTGTIYLSGDLTETIHVGDGLSSISNSATTFVVYDQWTVDSRYAVGEAPITVTNLGVMAWTRAKPNDAAAPVVIHLVDYMDNGAFDITLHPRRFFDTNLKITLLRPNAAPVVSYHASADTSTVPVPGLDPLGTGQDSWGVLVVEPYIE